LKCPILTKSLQVTTKSHGNKHPKRWVFKRLQKTGRDGADMTWCGRAFQVRAAAIGKARSSTVDSHVGLRQRGNDDVDAGRRRDLVPRSAGWKSSPTRYVSAIPLQHSESQNGELLYWIRSLLRSFQPM